MTPETLRYAAIMFAAGIGIPVLATLNAALGTRVGSPASAAVVLFAVALLSAIAVTVVTGATPLNLMKEQPKHLFLAGILVAFYILTITWIAPKFGVGNAVFFVLLGQLVSAAIIDHFGLVGARVQPLTAIRTLGILVMAFGVLITQMSVGPKG